MGTSRPLAMTLWYTPLLLDVNRCTTADLRVVVQVSLDLGPTPTSILSRRCDDHDVVPERPCSDEGDIVGRKILQASQPPAPLPRPHPLRREPYREHRQGGSLTAKGRRADRARERDARCPRCRAFGTSRGGADRLGLPPPGGYLAGLDGPEELDFLWVVFDVGPAQAGRL